MSVSYDKYNNEKLDQFLDDPMGCYMACLNDINPGQSAKVKKVLSTGSIRRRLLDIGFIEDTKVVCLGRSPGGDPSAFLIRGTVIALRSKDCKNILILGGDYDRESDCSCRKSKRRKKYTVQ